MGHPFVASGNRNNVSICKLCGLTAPLCNSHVYPDFFIWSLEREKPAGRSGQPQRYSILKSSRPEIVDGEKQRGFWEREVGLKERLLCTNCEVKFSAHEGYVRNLLYLPRVTPLKKLSLGTSIHPEPVRPEETVLDTRKITGVDYTKLRLFQLSVLWRASIASGTFFKNVDLGPKHESIIRDMLLTDDPGVETEYVCPMIDLQHNGDGCEDFMPQPDQFFDKKSKQWISRITLGGYLYVFYVSNRYPPVEPNFATVKETNEMIVGVSKAESVLQFWAQTLGEAGKL